MDSTMTRMLLLALALFLPGCGSAEEAEQLSAGPVNSRSAPADSKPTENEANEAKPVADSSPATAEPVSESLPESPLAIPVPQAPAGEIGDNDLSTVSPRVLGALALKQSAAGKYTQAVQLQHWRVANGSGDEGLYNLACFYSLTGDVDASFYWLQLAAAKEGVDADWATRDSDLANVRRDPRWKRVSAFLQQCNRYWQRSERRETTLVLPQDYDGQEPLTVMIGLHGLGGRARNFVDDDYQEAADELHVAFVGVSGTMPQGPTSFAWSEDPERDADRVRQALQEVSDRLTAAQGKVILFGFSQGAMMAAEIAAREPDFFAGALVMSPGGRGDLSVDSVSSQPAHARQGYVMVCGADEAPGNVRLTADYSDQMRRLKARVEHKPYAGISAHSFPPDYFDRLPAWIEFITDPNASAVAEAKPEPADDESEGDGMGPTFAFVCLKNDQLPDEPALRQACEKWLGTTTTSELELEIDREKRSMTVTSGDIFAIAAMIPKPVPEGDIRYSCGNAFLWPEAWEELKDHRAHLIVFASGEYEQRYNRPLFLSRVIASCTEAFSAAGIYWGDASVVHSPGMFRDLVDDVDGIDSIDDVPAMLWTGFLRDRHDDGSISFYTKGLQSFGCMELEVIRSRQQPAELLGLLHGTTQYLIFAGNVIEDGDTLGASETERIKSRYADSEIGRDMKVIRIDY